MPTLSRKPRYSSRNDPGLRVGVGLLQRQITVILPGLTALILGIGPTIEALVLPSQPREMRAFDSNSEAQQVQFYRLQVGSECEQTADCIGGECRADPVAGGDGGGNSGRKSCMCLPGTFRYVIAPALEICLRCRDLNALCSFDQECQCSDSNAVCDIQAPTGKGRCKCRPNFTPFFESRGKSPNFTCKTGGVQSVCSTDRDCSQIKFADSTGRLLELPRDPASNRHKPPIQAKCQAARSPVISTPPPALNIADVIQAGLEELDIFDSVIVSNATQSTSAPPTATSTRHQVPAFDIPEPRGSSNSTTVAEAFCKCPEGFAVARNDSYVCQDIDECADEEAGLNACNPVRLDNAQAVCVNTLGGFRCECNSTMALGQGLMATGGICCTEGHIPCLDSSRCIAFSKLCDGQPDCDQDCSDELYPFCNFNSYHSFPDFTHHPQCHEGVIQDQEVSSSASNVSKVPVITNGGFASVTAPDQQLYEDLLPLGARTSAASNRQMATPPSPLPTLPANMTAARLLGYILV
ncbi:hypothetical protein BV898_16225 [Hypsibius exemplaris]|uniref:NOTCH1 EGF-like calcium-binding domain-containing protein n=1 Tax=Hypsibius exemplaris TaxID=2072580 RepID=A0A9X6RL99_HYPEX|nr:hypothetical protein BV898_16225 [Hypsibius exemplaris]